MRAPAQVIDDLAAMRGVFGRDAAQRTVALLERLQRTRFRDAQELIRFHDLVLYLRAFPQSPRVLRLADEILFAIHERVAQVDEDPFDDTEVSGIAGTTISTNFSLPVAKSLILRHGRAISIDWENYEHADRLGAVLSLLVPESREDFAISAHPDARRWFAKLRGGLKTLITKVEPRVYDLLELPLRWNLGTSAASRSRTRLPRREIFYHKGPFLRRKDVSLEAGFREPRSPVTRLTARASRKILDLILDTSAVRYRELYGFAHPDAAHVQHADLGRGVDFYFFGVPRNRRLIREYHAGMYFKNGVPIGYVELLTRDGVMEVGFNLYYAFRESETAWLYARLLKIFHERLGAKSFWIDRYQIGHENQEAIDSGAYWFYRKLGYASVSAKLRELSASEEAKLAQPGYRTSPATLTKLALAAMQYEV
ncbi:MAG TPA: hypothetical protein VGP79_16590 [Bryobacteraceae bacterium]|nr:hypothetical protein [Bryobacteraceae bacterium]